MIAIATPTDIPATVSLSSEEAVLSIAM